MFLLDLICIFILIFRYSSFGELSTNNTVLLVSADAPQHVII